MKLKLRYLLVSVLFFCKLATAQDIALYEQFNGRFDFTFTGNTLNAFPNNLTSACTINTSSAAVLNLGSGNVVEKAYLYWAGSGSGDFYVKLNGTDITASRTFSFLFQEIPYFSAFADITTQVQTAGDGTYVFSDLDLNAVINTSVYCENRTNFGGWAILIVYKNPALPLNQLNIYDGLQGVPNEISITLNSLNVIDNVGAKIGFIAWEGDRDLFVSETLSINNLPLSNALNPPNNAFNGTNTITGAINLYNMDLDIYDIQNTIAIGDSSALIELTSGQDFVLINTIVTKLNSQLPDAVITIDNINQQCDSRTITVDYTVSNPDSTNFLPAAVPILIFANDLVIGQTQTTTEIPINGSQSGTITLTIPPTVPDNFTLEFAVDMNAEQLGTVTEINEDNNTATVEITLWKSPTFNALPTLTVCNIGLRKGIFDFSSYEELVKTNPSDTILFFRNLEDASANTNAIADITNYTSGTTPETIYIRLSNANCSSVTSFLLTVKNCPPKIYNLVATNPDNYYDTFLIDGLRDIFTNFNLTIYNRYGAMVWEGNNNTADWDGSSNKGSHPMGNDLPEGTYYYILELNDPDYPSPMTGFVYLKKG